MCPTGWECKFFNAEPELAPPANQIEVLGETHCNVKILGEIPTGGGVCYWALTDLQAEKLIHFCFVFFVY